MRRTISTVIILLMVLLVSACAGPAQLTEAPAAPATSEPVQQTEPPAATAPAQLPNPASQNCIEQGGTLEIQERGDGGQYGVCYFEDNRQCEEWALMRGECPVGGLKITGYITDAAQYCAITGGTYAITGNSGQDDEQGSCTLPNDVVCDVWEYYNGKCETNTAPTETAALTIQPLSMEVCNGQAQAMSHTLDDLVPTQSETPLDDFVNNASGIGCQATITGNGAQFESPSAVVGELGGMLEEEGWTVDPMLVADGPSGTSKGYRKVDQICLASAVWEPDASANCPTNQPVSACQVTPEQQLYTVTLNCGEEVTQGEAATNAGQLVFDSTRGDGYRDLFLMNSDGSGITRLTEGDSNSFAGPWSPDGQRILYTGFGPTNSYIAVINADGSGSTILDQVDNSDEGFSAWSPNGQHIAFTSRREGNNEIYVMNADGSNPVRLTDNPMDDLAPSWSPDGSKIAFVSDRDQAQGINDIYIMSADGSAVTRLTSDEAIDYTPVWSPNGSLIAFRSDESGHSDIFLINADGTGRINLTNSDSNEWSPAWSPDGTQIAFQTDRDGNWEIYMMSADGSGPVNLTNDPSDDQLPFWKP